MDIHDDKSSCDVIDYLTSNTLNQSNIHEPKHDQISTNMCYENFDIKPQFQKDTLEFIRNLEREFQLYNPDENKNQNDSPDSLSNDLGFEHKSMLVDEKISANVASDGQENNDLCIYNSNETVSQLNDILKNIDFTLADNSLKKINSSEYIEDENSNELGRSSNYNRISFLDNYSISSVLPPFKKQVQTSIYTSSIENIDAQSKLDNSLSFYDKYDITTAKDTKTELAPSNLISEKFQTKMNNEPKDMNFSEEFNSNELDLKVDTDVLNNSNKDNSLTNQIENFVYNTKQVSMSYESDLKQLMSKLKGSNKYFFANQENLSTTDPEIVYKSMDDDLIGETKLLQKIEFLENMMKETNSLLSLNEDFLQAKMLQNKNCGASIPSNNDFLSVEHKISKVDGLKYKDCNWLQVLPKVSATAEEIFSKISKNAWGIPLTIIVENLIHEKTKLNSDEKITKPIISSENFEIDSENSIFISFED